MSRDCRVPWRNETAYRKCPIMSRPWYSNGSGGIVSQASSVSRATIAATSPRSNASAKRAVICCSRGAGQRGLVAPARRQVAGDRGPGSLEQVVRGVQGAAEDGRRLGGAEPEHVAEHQGGALPGREVLQGGDEGQRHRFPDLIPRLGSRGGIRQVAEQRVGVGLQPQRLAAAGGL